MTSAARRACRDDSGRRRGPKALHVRRATLGGVSTDDPSVTVEIRHQGRLYAAQVSPNGSTTIARDGLWFCNADWNGRALDTGDHALHPELDTATTIREALGAAILATPLAGRRTRPGRGVSPGR